MENKLLPSCCLIATLLCGCSSSGGKGTAQELPATSDTSGTLTISQSQPELIRNVFKGILPAPSGGDTAYTLTICSARYSGDGTFTLERIFSGSQNGADSSSVLTGNRYTQRGIPGEADATVWQCISDPDKQIFNFLVRKDSALILLRNDFTIPAPTGKYTLQHIKGRQINPAI